MLESKAFRSSGGAPVTSCEGTSEGYLLERFPVLSGLPVTVQRELEQACRYRRFSEGELIFDRESTATDVFFVLRGRVRVVNYSLSGREIAFEDFTEGDLFGELSAIDGQPRPAAVVAVEETVVLALAARHFVDVLTDHPQVALKVMRGLTAQVRAAGERIMDLSTLTANNRVHAELLRQARSLQNQRDMAVIEPIPIHSDIASRVSTTRETVARVLNDLARRGVIERTRNALVIRKVQLLQSMVQQVRG